MVHVVQAANDAVACWPRLARTIETACEGGSLDRDGLALPDVALCGVHDGIDGAGARVDAREELGLDGLALDALDWLGEALSSVAVLARGEHGPKIVSEEHDVDIVPSCATQMQHEWLSK